MVVISDMTTAGASGNATVYRSIILQLKSSQDKFALSDMHAIILFIKKELGYKVRCHERHQTQRNMERMAQNECVTNVEKFSSQNEIEFLTYHVSVLRNEGRCFLMPDLTKGPLNS